MHSTHCSFLNLSSKHKGFICLDINTSRIYIFHHVIFHEFDFFFASSSSSHSQFTPIHSTLPLIFPFDAFPCATSVAPHLSPNPPSVSAIPSLIDNPPELPIVPAPLHPFPSNHHPMLTCSKTGYSKPKLFLAHSSTTTIPSSYKEAANISSWQDVMHCEFHALLKNNT